MPPINRPLSCLYHLATDNANGAGSDNKDNGNNAAAGNEAGNDVAGAIAGILGGLTNAGSKSDQ